MNNKKEKSGKFSFGKKKKNKNKEAKNNAEEEILLKVPTLETDQKQTPVTLTQTQPKVVIKESQEEIHGRINERAVDVGDVVRAPQNRPAVTSTSGLGPLPSNHQTANQQNRQNGITHRITDNTADPIGPKRVHSFSVESTRPTGQQLLTKDEKKHLKHSHSAEETIPTKDSVTYEEEKQTSSKKKKKYRAILGSLRGKESKKARKSLTEVFNEEASKITRDGANETQSPVDMESSSSEEEMEDDQWDNDPRNPFSSSFVSEEEHTAQSPISKIQQNKVLEASPPTDKVRVTPPEKEEPLKGNKPENKKKKRKLKVPSFRKPKKSLMADHSPTSQKSESLPTTSKLTDDVVYKETDEPEAIVELRHPQPPEKPPRLHSYSYESPDKFVCDEENALPMLSREERNKSKQFSSMRVSNKAPRPTLWLTSEDDKVKENKGKNSTAISDEEDLPPNIDKKKRHGSNIFASFRKRKQAKLKDLEKVAEDEDEEVGNNDDAEISTSYTDSYRPTEVTGVRSSAPPNFSHPVFGQQDAAQSGISKQRSQTLPSNHARNHPPATVDASNQRLRAESTTSETLAMIEETQEISSEAKKKKRIPSIRKTFSLKKSAKEAKEIRQTYLRETQEEEDLEEESQPLNLTVQEECSVEDVYEFQETEVDIEIRRKELESVFKDMESEEEEEEKPKSKNPKQLLKVLKKKTKKKKSDSKETEAFPLMDQSQPVENKDKKNAAEKIVEVRSQLTELTDIAHGNIKKLEEREDNLEDLEERADILAKTASEFDKIAVQVKTKVETCNVRTKRIIIGVIIAILVLIVIILIAVVSNKSDTTEVRTVHIIHVINGTAPYITPSPG